jgi:hypothetical protein
MNESLVLDNLPRGSMDSLSKTVGENISRVRGDITIQVLRKERPQLIISSILIKKV